MDKLRLALVGCGGMGTRHLHGLKQLADSPFDAVELSAVCDISAENAEMAAAEAEKLLGTRPKVCTNMEAMVQQVPDLEAVDVVTDPSVHHNRRLRGPRLGLARAGRKAAGHHRASLSADPRRSRAQRAHCLRS